jgi:uncharacterized membrane protein YhaH (DUF805 family)
MNEIRPFLSRQTSTIVCYTGIVELQDKGAMKLSWYLKVIKNYVNFGDRARRKEYWMFTLFNLLITLGIFVIQMIAGIDGWLNGLYSLFILLPSLAVSIRRLHDTGRSGWWILISLIPVVGAIVILVFMCLEGESRSNKWGQNPKFGGGYL